MNTRRVLNIGDNSKYARGKVSKLNYMDTKASIKANFYITSLSSTEGNKGKKENVSLLKIEHGKG